MKTKKNKKTITLVILILVHLTSATKLFSQNVGIGIVNPLQKLHIAGVSSTVRIEGLATGGGYITSPLSNTDNLLFSDAAGDIHKMPNGTSGQIPVINNSGSLFWANAPVKYSVTGTSPAVLNTFAAQVLMPQMTITFVPKNAVVWVFFYAMGSATVPEVPIQFQLRKAGVPIIRFKASSEGSLLNEWVSSMSFPVAVTPGVTTTLDITWAEGSSSGYQITNSGGNPLCRTLMVLDMQ